MADETLPPDDTLSSSQEVVPPPSLPSNVIRLVPPPPRETAPSEEHKPNQEAVAILEQVLESAKAGDLNGLAISFTMMDGSTGTSCTMGETGNIWQLIGSVAFLQQVLMAQIDEVDD